MQHEEDPDEPEVELVPPEEAALELTDRAAEVSCTPQLSCVKVLTLNSDCGNSLTDWGTLTPLCESLLKAADVTGINIR